MSALLLLATPSVPLLMLAALGFWPRVARLIWAAPLPGLAGALFANGTAVVWDSRLGLGASLDAPGALLLGGAALLWVAAGVYALAYLGDKPGFGRFAACWLATMSGSLGVFVAADLITFYFVFALASLPAWGLVIHDGTERSWRAGGTYLLLAVLGEAALLAAFALLAALAPGDSVAIAEVVRAVPATPPRGVLIALLLIGFGLKAGLWPLHVWLPIAHPAAPMPASAVLSGAIVKAGVIGLIRFLPAEAVPPGWGAAMAALGFLTAFWGVGCGVLQRNPKTVLAYSTVSQMGVVVAALGMGLVLGVATTPVSVAFYALHHMLAKGALFLAVGVAASRAGRARWWWVLAPALALALGFGGLPPTGGALAKAAVKEELGEGLAGLLAALSAVGSTALMLHFVRRLAATPEGDASPAPGLLLPWLLLALAAVVLPWAMFAPAGGDFSAALAPSALLKAAWPVALGALLAWLLGRAEARLPGVPEGDVIVLARLGSERAARIGAALVRLEALIRPWPVVGVSLLGLSLLLIAAMAGALG